MYVYAVLYIIYIKIVKRSFGMINIHFRRVVTSQKKGEYK